ncbi:hypothetical protein FACS18949_04790 [Clostridia bacterium]|nr:hypothetical protein FACS189425_10600 [Clostridia bacterium]GHV32775.1 hypothetical protein FACS18949_04790 [Clostridia bacterium]
MITVQVVIFGLLFVGLLFILSPPRTLSFSEGILREKRENIISRRLSPWERLTVKVKEACKNAGFSLRTFLIITVAACGVGTIVGRVLFGDFQLGLATGVALLPVPYIYMLLRGQSVVRKELESLENTMSIITNAYMGGGDIVEAFYGYVKERNHHRDPDSADTSPFDEFVTEILLINPDVERGLYLLEAKIRNYHFSEWVMPQPPLRFAIAIVCAAF